MSNKRVYTKKNELMFNVTEVRELSSDVDVIQQMNVLAQYINKIREIEKQQIEQLRKTIEQLSKEYNFRVEVMGEASDKLKLPFIVPAKINEVYSEIDFDNLPKIKLPNEKGEEIPSVDEKPADVKEIEQEVNGEKLVDNQ